MENTSVLCMSSITGRETYLLNFISTGDGFFARARRAFEIAAMTDRSAPAQANDRLQPFIKATPKKRKREKQRVVFFLFVFMGVIAVLLNCV